MKAFGRLFTRSVRQRRNDSSRGSTANDLISSATQILEDFADFEAEDIQASLLI